MPMGKSWRVLRALLLVALFVFVQRGNLFGQSTHFFISSDLGKDPLTHTVFHGSTSHYNKTLFSSEEDNPGEDIASNGGRRDQVELSWKYNIVATVFWIGEQAVEGNPVPNTESAWDASWVAHYGGEDNPEQRANFIPTAFTPGQNPFYVALPYNDVDDHHTRREAAGENNTLAHLRRQTKAGIVRK